MSEDHAELEVAIVRWIDDEPQPGIVEFEFSDRFGRQWHFHEKQALVSNTWLGAGNIYPQPGSLRCRVLSQSQDSEGRSIAEIDTSRPWHVESIEEVSRFQVFASQLLPEGPSSQDGSQD